MKTNILIASLLCAGALASFGAPPVFQTPKMREPLQLDGKESPAWKDASVLYGFYERVSGNLEPRKGRTLFGYE